jgi:hypothetical protein
MTERGIDQYNWGEKKGYLSTGNGILLPRLLPHIGALFFLSLSRSHTHSHYTTSFYV